MNTNRYFILLILLATMLLGGLAACQSEEDAPTGSVDGSGEGALAEAPVNQVNDVAVGGFGSVSAEGQVVPLTSADLSFQMGGHVAEIMVASGDNLNEGDPIMRLDSAALENGLTQAEAGLTAAEAARDAALAELAVAQSGVGSAQSGITSAEAQLELVKAGATAEELDAAEKNLAAAEASIVAAAGSRDASVRVSDSAVGAAQARVAAAQAELDSVQRTYDEIIDLCFDKPGGGQICPLYGPVEEQTRAQLEASKINLAAAQAAEAEARAGATPAERHFANTGVGVAAAGRDQAQAQLELLKAGPREELIQQAQVGVAQAKLGEEQALVQVTLAEAAVTQAEASVTKAQADVEAAQKALDRMTLTAPFDGSVGEILTEVGELVGPRTARRTLC